MRADSMLCCCEPSCSGLGCGQRPPEATGRRLEQAHANCRYLFYRVLKLGKDARLSQFFPKDASEPFLRGQSMWGP